MAQKLSIGDVVKLKSDGPLMTVVKDKTDLGSKFVQVGWFDGSAFRTEQFHKDTLDYKGQPKEEGTKAAADA